MAARGAWFVWRASINHSRRDWLRASMVLGSNEARPFYRGRGGERAIVRNTAEDTRSASAKSLCSRDQNSPAIEEAGVHLPRRFRGSASQDRDRDVSQRRRRVGVLTRAPCRESLRYHALKTTR